MIKKMIFTSLLLLSINSYAEVPEIFVFFINGVNNNEDNVKFTSDQLKELNPIYSNMVTWDYLYNPTNGLLSSDLWDVLRQKKQENKQLTIDDYTIAYNKSYNLNYAIDSPEYNKLKDSIKDKYLHDPSFVGVNLPYIVNEFNEKVRNPKNSYVLLIPHSQGNLYANQLYEYLVRGNIMPENHIAILGIGSPASEIKGTIESPDRYSKEKYFTADNDSVINNLNIFSGFLPSTNPSMRSNIHINDCEDDLCHGMIDSYLNDENTRNKIKKQIANFIIPLKQNMINENASKTIRLLFNIHAINGAELIDETNKTICTDKVCDTTIIRYIETTNGLYDRYENQFIAFEDHVKPGKYTLLSNKIDSPNAGITMKGNIKDAYIYDFDKTNCTWINQKPIYNPILNSTDPFYNKFQSNLETNISYQNACYLKYPELTKNGKFVAGVLELY